jgi:hypothetical protein
MKTSSSYIAKINVDSSLFLQISLLDNFFLDLCQTFQQDSTWTISPPNFTLLSSQEPPKPIISIII